VKILVSSPKSFIALTEKINVPVSVGVPDRTPVSPSKLSPAGKSSISLKYSQVIGATPEALNVRLYDSFKTPVKGDVVLILGAEYTPKV